MDRGDKMTRYARQLAVIGPDAQNRLDKARVLIVGAGGLAAPVLQYLAGAGVGRLRLVDPDIVEVTNLHRQTLFRIDDLGQAKVVAAAACLDGLNPDCTVEPIKERLDPANVAALAEGCDLILDCADSFAASYVLSDHAFQSGVPLISGSVIGRQGYAGGFCGGAPSLRAVFPDLPDRAGSCATEGVIGSVVGVIGSLQADMALNWLAGLAPSPLGRIVSFDAARQQFGGFGFADAPEPMDRLRFIAPMDLRPADLLIDLRAPEEGPPVREATLRCGPDRIGPDLPQPGPGGRTVLCCKSGLRAWRAAEKLADTRAGTLVLLATG